MNEIEKYEFDRKGYIIIRKLLKKKTGEKFAFIYKFIGKACNQKFEKTAT